MNEHIQVILLMGAVFTALTTALGTVVGVLCYFLRRLCATLDRIHEVHLPEMVTAFQGELRAERTECHSQHAIQNRRADERHQQIMESLRSAMILLALLACAGTAIAQQPAPAILPGPHSHIRWAVVEIPSHGGSGTVIATWPAKSWILTAAHMFEDPADRARHITVKLPAVAGWPKEVPVQKRVLAVEVGADLALVEVDYGPLPYVAPVAPAGWIAAGHQLLSVGHDSLKIPPQQVVTHILGTSGETTFTLEKPWHGRSGGALLDMDGGYLVGVVSGYEVPYEHPRTRGIYVSLPACNDFLRRVALGAHPAVPPRPASPPARRVSPPIRADPRSVPGWGYQPPMNPPPAWSYPPVACPPGGT